MKLFLDGLKCSLLGKKKCDTNEVCVIFSNRISREKLDKGNYYSEINQNVSNEGFKPNGKHGAEPRGTEFLAPTCIT